MNRLSRKYGKFLVTLIGGPYHGEQHAVSRSGTLPFRVKEWHGYYDSSNKWVDLNEVRKA